MLPAETIDKNNFEKFYSGLVVCQLSSVDKCELKSPFCFVCIFAGGTKSWVFQRNKRVCESGYIYENVVTMI